MDTKHLILILFQSIPEAIVLISSSLILLGYNLKDKVFKISIIGLCNGLALGLIRQYLPVGYNSLLGLCLITISLWLVLKINIIKSFIITLLGIILVGVFESIFLPCWQIVLNMPMEDILTNHPISPFVNYPYLLLLGIISIHAKKKKFSLTKLDSVVITHNSLALILTIFVLIFIIVFINLIFFTVNTNNQGLTSKFIPAFTNIILIFCSIVAVYFIKRLFSLAEHDAIILAQETYTKNIDDLFYSYRAQRHDFNNHLQTIYGMVHKSGNIEAIQYLDAVLDDYQELNDLIRIKNTPVAALLKAKQALANSNNINFDISIIADLRTITIKPHELIRIFGNLIDNAIEAELQLESKYRWIDIEISIQGKFYMFKIANSSPILSNQEIAQLFEEGYTTKNKDNHSGLGLTTVKRLLEKHNGEIIVESSKKTGTKFMVLLPRGTTS